jgi:protein-S-isoprenylcysteine O-methyltransferase Ste14
VSWTLLLVLVVFAILVLGAPLVRAWRQTGKLAFVAHHGVQKGPVELQLLPPLVGVGALGFLLGGFAYAVAYGALGAAFFGGPEPVGPRAWAGIGVMALGTGIIALAQAQMGESWRIGLDDRPTELVDRGLYRYVRHPIYSGLLVWLVGLVLFAPTPVLTLGAMMLAAGVALQARLEEQHLLALHGEAYRERALRVGRFVPGLGRDLRPLPGSLGLALTAALLSVSALDLLQVMWLAWVSKHVGALGGALLYGGLAVGAWRQARWAALIPAIVPLLPLTLLTLSLLGAGPVMGVRPDTAMVVILGFQLVAAGLGMGCWWTQPQRERDGGGV